MCQESRKSLAGYFVRLQSRSWPGLDSNLEAQLGKGSLPSSPVVGRIPVLVALGIMMCCFFEARNGERNSKTIRLARQDLT